MDARRGTVLAGIAGILFAVLSLTRVIYSGELDLPAWDAAPAEITTYYTDRSLDAAFVVAMCAVLVGYALFLVFMAKAVDVLLPRQSDHRWAASWIFGFAAMDVALVFFFIALGGALRQMSEIGVSNPDSFAALHAGYMGLYWVDLILQPFWLGPVGYLIFKNGLFPRWLGVVMLATAAVQPVAFFVPSAVWDITGLTYIWVAIAAAVVVWRPERYMRAVQPSPP